MSNRIDADMAGVVWTRTLKERVVPYPTLADDLEVDLAVVGAGFCGLSLAIHAAGSGMRVAVLEGGRVGCGASGRNGGFAVPHFVGRTRPSAVIAQLGKRKGEELCELVASGPDRVLKRAERFQIRCDAVQNGWMQPAHSESALAAACAIYEDWKALGADVEWLDAGAIKERFGARYLGGWVRANGTHLNPYSLSLGLARAAAACGASIFETSLVTAIAPGKPSRLTVNGRTVTARKVVIAGNGYADRLVAGEHRAVVPVCFYHVATRPLSKAQRSRLLPRNDCFSDMRKSGGYGRLDAEGRLISGGMVFEPGGMPWGRAHARRRIAELFPDLGPVEFETYWDGWCGASPDLLPRVQALGSDVFSIGGYSSRGVALAQNAGEMIAELVAEKRRLDDVPLPVTIGEDPYPLHAIKSVGARLIFPWYQLRDRLGFS